MTRHAHTTGERRLRAVRDKDTRTIVRNALAGGWVFVRYTKAGHIEIRWPATNQSLFTGTTPSDRNAWKTFARDVLAVSGIDPRVKPSKRRTG